MPPPSKAAAEEEEEEDYMNMIIIEPSKPVEKETYTQRRMRKQRESEARGRAKTKDELAGEEAAALEAALSKSLFTDPAAASKNKGLAMMAKMGFKPGSALGSKDNIEARVDPIGISKKEDRGGIGLDTEKKRKFQEAVEEETKRVKVEQGDYRERVRREREEARLEGMVGAAMRTAERMDNERKEYAAEAAEASEAVESTKKLRVSEKPLKSTNILWRGLVRKREEKERDSRMRYNLQQSLSRLPTYNDPDEENEDKLAMGKMPIQHTLVEDLEEEDLELDDFNTLLPAERLHRLVLYLRAEFNYCFWCKYTYPDKEMDGCPGLTEEDHD